MDDNDDLYEEDEQNCRKIIAMRECTANYNSHYNIGYQSGLLTTLERRETQAQLETVRKAAVQSQSKWIEFYREQARKDLKKVSEARQKQTIMFLKEKQIDNSREDKEDHLDNL